MQISVVCDLHAEIEEVPGSIQFMHYLARFLFEGKAKHDAQLLLARLSTTAYNGLYDSPVPVVNRVINRQVELDYLFRDTNVGNKIRAKYPAFGGGIMHERQLTIGMMTGRPTGEVACRPIIDLFIAGMSISRLWQVAQYVPSEE